MKNNFVVAAAAVALSGCTAVTVKPVDTAERLDHICIQDNPKVIVSDFVPVVRDRFYWHGVSSEVFSGSIPEQCQYVLTYTALRSWDFATYLSHAELRIEHDGRQIAYAEYHLRGKGGFSLNKWGSTKSKMDPVIDELLSGRG
ncbi:hypothetical protein GCM10007160_00180 [Litchfieldella qijiaojingensis]|uniref:Lipoprotein n=1 Tax=Litchfieldella qijiaojingensis TaxID=980347 RepID=A0ABQ2Y9B5_9GAMM|nr:Sbal_3080 family lipoprotein [Halomonas qijiaojingensis]GGX76995.1 hypothetical protein GCM10007160_00180 [Halomonas qijiaojingensis]